MKGKCKVDFEKYRLKNYSETELEIRGAGVSVWEAVDDSMRWGVYVDYYDSVGIILEINICIHGFDFMIHIDKDIIQNIGWG